MKKIAIIVPFLAILAVSANASESVQSPAPLSAETKTPPESVPATTAADDNSFETPLPYPSARLALARIGKSYSRYAAALGCVRFAWGTISTDGSKFTLKYLPPGGTLTAWTKMAVITVYSLPGDKGPLDAQAIARTISETEGEYIKLAHVTNDQNFPAPRGEITMFLQYTLGQIDAAAALIRTGRSASLIQLQQRDGKLSPDDVLKVTQFASPAASQSPLAPAKK